MIVCVCKRVSDRQIRALAREGVCCVAEMQMETGCGTCCGQCLPVVRELIEETAEAQCACMGAMLAAA